MKALIILFLLCPMLGIGQCILPRTGFLRAEVSGDTAVLYNDSACRNCGSVYNMELSFYGNDTLVWLQKDNGAPAFCDCNYNLSVTIDSLHPGSFTVLVYYTEIFGDTEYIGTVNFTVAGVNAFLIPGLAGHYQSACFDYTPPIPGIDSLEILPADPTTEDSVKVVAYTVFPSGGCPLINSSVIASGPDISVYSFHSIGFMTYICHSTDTITIGKLNAGNYELIYFLSDTVVSVPYDADTVNFTVQETIDIFQYDFTGGKIKIYPVPADGELFIEISPHPGKTYFADLYSVPGQNLKRVSLVEKITKMDISDLKDGIYYISVSDSNLRYWYKKIIKN